MSFVEFNETTGEIISVGNMFEKDKLCIPIDPKIAKALISGTEQSINWRVVPDKKESQVYFLLKDCLLIIRKKIFFKLYKKKMFGKAKQF